MTGMDPGSLSRYVCSMLADDYLPLIRCALAEDLAVDGDVTSSALFSDETTNAYLESKDTGVLAGREVFEAVFGEVDRATRVEFRSKDGDRLSPGDVVAEIEGKTTSVLAAERTALNFLSFMTGIASEARRFSDAARNGRGTATILDTRKTLPGYRKLSKYAVRMGGAENHRLGLYDMVLIKDNHVDAAGSITEAVRRVRGRWGDRFRVEVECRSTGDVQEAVACDVDVVMLDNMSLSEMSNAVRFRKNGIEFEASGNMTIERIAEVAGTGVDSISCGALTHTVRSFDFSLHVRNNHE